MGTDGILKRTQNGQSNGRNGQISSPGLPNEENRAIFTAHSLEINGEN
jgi:hypothetical protein